MQTTVLLPVQANSSLMLVLAPLLRNVELSSVQDSRYRKSVKYI